MQTVAALTHNTQAPLSFAINAKLIIMPIGNRHIVLRKKCRSKAETLLFVLERQHVRFETAVCAAVDKCSELITAHVRRFFAHREQCAEEQINSAFKNRRFGWSNQWIEQILPPGEFERMQTDVRSEIQFEMNRVFGITSLQDAVAGPSVNPEYWEGFSQVWAECLQTVLMIDGMAKMGNLLWNKSLARLNLPSPVGKLLEEYKLGSRLMGLGGCDAGAELRRGETEMVRRARGILRNMEQAAVRELSRSTARIFYKLADERTAVKYDSRVKLLKDKAAAVRRPILHLAG